MKSSRVFERLDQSYLDDLVVRAGKGSSNAFAELFASVSGRQLCYLTYMLGDREQAVSVLGEVFATALRSLPSLAKPRLFMPWISRIAANAAMDRRPGLAEDDGREGGYALSQLLNLPLVESQIMLMHFAQGMSDAEIGDILNMSRSTVRKFIKAGQRHLSGDSRRYRIEPAGKDSRSGYRSTRAGDSRGGKHAGSENNAADNGRRERDFGLVGRRNGLNLQEVPGLGAVEAADILDSVFENCGRDANTVPMEALSSYAVYRKERFSLQRGILAAALALFMLIPGLFLIPEYTVDVQDEGERGLPVYTVEVNSLMPVGRVLASLKGHSLPVYEADARKYTIEPTRNGSLQIDVELINRQRVSSNLDVTAVDARGPRLLGSSTPGDSLILNVTDDGIGVDYREIYAVSKSGQIHYPVSADEENGVVFEYPDETWDIYIPDHIGNTLHLAVRLS